MKIIVLLLISTLQWFGYSVVISIGKSQWRYLLLIALIVGHVLVFPLWYGRLTSSHTLDCGNPMIGTYLFFVIIGVPLTIVTHFAYKRRINKKPK